MRKISWLSRFYLVLTALLLGGYLYFWDYLPPRTARKVTRLLSGIDVPLRAKTERFSDQWGTFTGDGHTSIVFRLSAADFNRLRRQHAPEGYAPLTPNVVAYAPLVYPAIGLKGSLYKWVRKPRPDRTNYVLVVFDQAHHRLLIQNTLL